MNSKMISDVISHQETTFKIDSKHLSEIKLSPECIINGKVIVNVKSILFNDTITI